MSSLFDCRSAESQVAVERYGLIGDCTCIDGCYTPSQHPQLIEVYSAVEGLEFPDLPNHVPILPLPGAIRTIPGDSPLPFRVGPLGPVLATRYTQIGGLREKVIDFQKLKGWRKRRNVPDHKGLLLIQESSDKVLESLFPATLNPDFFRAISTLGNVVLMSPGYSVYDNGKFCEWLQLLNMKRSLFFAYMANLAGLPCIPCIGWHRHRPRDLERLAEWLNRQGDKVTHLAVNAQTGSTELWGDLAAGMAYLEQATGRKYQWLVCGGTDALGVLYRRFPSSRITHVSAAVSTYTLKHRLLGQRATNDLPPNELLRQNIEREESRQELAVMLAAHGLPARKVV